MSDWMHSQREEALKTPRLRSLFSRSAKNCLARYVRNYAARSARGPCGKPIKAESWELVSTGSAIQEKLRDGSRRRNELQGAVDRPAFADRQFQASDFPPGGDVDMRRKNRYPKQSEPGSQKILKRRETKAAAFSRRARGYVYAGSCTIVALPVLHHEWDLGPIATLPRLIYAVAERQLNRSIISNHSSVPGAQSHQSGRS